LVKTFNKVFSNGETDNVMESMGYLKNLHKYVGDKYQIPRSARDPTVYLDIFAKGIIHLIQKAISIRSDLVSKKKMTPKDAHDKGAGILCDHASQLHGIVIILRYNIEKVTSLNEGPLKRALSKLSLLFAIEQTMAFSSQLFEGGAIDGDFLSDAKELFEKLLLEIDVDA